MSGRRGVTSCCWSTGVGAVPFPVGPLATPRASAGVAKPTHWATADSVIEVAAGVREWRGDWYL